MNEILQESGCLLEGHFLLSSGKHSNRYVQCARLTEWPSTGETVAQDIVRRLDGVAFDTVVGPAMGGILIAYELARQTGKRMLFTERQDGEMTLRRGFQVQPGERVLICEDVVTTGISSMETARALEEAGAVVVGIAAIIDRTSGPVALPLYAAYRVEVDTYDADDCPLCQAGVPLVKPGSRTKKA